MTDFEEDFKGGEFVFVDGHDKLNRTIEPRLGRVSFFTSGVENKHYVKRVTSGVRYALTLGFTCDATKAIKEPGSELVWSETVKEKKTVTENFGREKQQIDVQKDKIIRRSSVFAFCIYNLYVLFTLFFEW